MPVALVLLIAEAEWPVVTMANVVVVVLVAFVAVVALMSRCHIRRANCAA
jgi:hypothetical protein